MTIPKASLLDSFWFNLCHVVPYYLAGIFASNRRWMGWLTYLEWHPFSVRLGHRWQRKYGSDFVFINMMGRQSLVLLDTDAVAHVLDHSPDIYAETRLKRLGMSHWQPNSVTISRGDAWRVRRKFNERVLASGERVHPDAEYFLRVIQGAVRAAQPERWDDFAKLFDRIMLQVIFGDGVDASQLSETLGKLRSQANQVLFLRKSKLYDEFVSAIRGQLAQRSQQGLVARFGDVDASDEIYPENQLPHWMFAIKETVAANAIRALALIVAHPDVESRVREELREADLTTPAGIDSLRYLEGCIQEAMRLWPTTPLLIREMVASDTLGGTVLPRGTQVLIFNNFHHRNTQTYPDADRFRPLLWAESATHYQFNHFSNGPQVCAGKHLALFIAKATLATLLAGHKICLEHPKLQPEKPLPLMYNYFDIRFTRGNH